MKKTIGTVFLFLAVIGSLLVVSTGAARADEPRDDGYNCETLLAQKLDELSTAFGTITGLRFERDQAVERVHQLEDTVGILRYVRDEQTSRINHLEDDKAELEQRLAASNAEVRKQRAKTRAANAEVRRLRAVIRGLR